jgi:hypothetical protein
MSELTLDDSVSRFTLPFPDVDAPRPPRRRGVYRESFSSRYPDLDAATASIDAFDGQAPIWSFFDPASGQRAFARWFAARLPQQGPQLDDHAFKFPAVDREECAWDWRCSQQDVCGFLLVRDEDGAARDPGTAQILSWFQATADEACDPAERLWALKDYLYRFEAGRRWHALLGEIDVRSRKLAVAWIGGFEGLVWNEQQTLRAIVPTPGSLADEAMPDPMSLRLDWTGRIAVGIGVARCDLSAFRRDDRTPLPFQIHRTTDRR